MQVVCRLLIDPFTDSFYCSMFAIHEIKFAQTNTSCANIRPTAQTQTSNPHSADTNIKPTLRRHNIKHKLRNTKYQTHAA